MNIQSAIEILNEHQKWRKGNENVTMISPSITTDAIETILEYHKQFAQQEVSDEEIEKSAEKFYPTDDIYREMWAENRCWQMGAKWYREQLKLKKD